MQEVNKFYVNSVESVPNACYFGSPERSTVQLSMGILNKNLGK